jgi:rhamnose utilization protein RhaD (predicted bifunctional aldolase and dehydrogenase)
MHRLCPAVAVTFALAAASASATDLNAAGVREALSVASDRAVALAAKPGGFLDNALIHIKLPKTVRKIGSALRAVGMGKQVDELEVGLNRAAERASAEAKPVFVDAIKRMTLQDAVGIVRGGDTAATDYFRGATEETLRERFRPIVASSLAKVGARRQYDSLVAEYRALPFAEPTDLDLDDYTTKKTLDGLFALLAQEETKIRKDPAKQTTALLRKLFAQ